MFPERWYTEQREYEQMQLAAREVAVSDAIDRKTDLGTAIATAEPIGAITSGTVEITADPAVRFDALMLTAEDLTELTQGGRGRYRASDTRGFAMHHEQSCEQFNCWMTRGADGTPHYWSQPQP